MQKIAQATLYSAHKDELEEITNVYDGTLETLLPKGKGKYGQEFFETGGKVLNYIFGTATAQELQHISNVVKSYT
jgi:hypothetical protein